MDAHDDSEDEILHPYIEVEFLEYVDPLLTSPLTRAIKELDMESAVSLIRQNKHINEPDNNGFTPLIHAVTQDNLEFVNLLLQASDIDINYETYTKMSALHFASKGSSDAVVMRLLDEGCHINTSDVIGQTPLHLAISRISSLVAEELIKRGADINATDFNGYSPLHESVVHKNLEVTCLLLCYGADVSICCHNGLTPFMHAVNDIDKIEIARVLMDYYDDFSTVAFVHNFSSLLLAANCKSPIAMDIVHAGGDVNHYPENDISALGLSIYYPHADLFKEIWSRLDLKKFARRNRFFLAYYIKYCEFPLLEWTECFYIIFGSPIIKQLLDVMLDGTETLVFFKLIHKICLIDISADERLSMVYCLLSYGVALPLYELDLIYIENEFCKELEILVDNAAIGTYDLRDHWSLFSLFILGLDGDKDFVVNTLKAWIERPYFPMMHNHNCTVLRAFKFYSLSPNEKQHILATAANKRILYKILRTIPEFPSLLELARDRVRNIIKHNEKVKLTHRFHAAVKGLEIPISMKDLLTFKKALFD